MSVITSTWQSSQVFPVVQVRSCMEFLMQLVFLMPLVITLASAQTNNATNSVQTSFLPPHCPNKCGNISIKYPFGFGVDCSRPGFELICDNSSGVPELFIDKSRTYQITSIDTTIEATTGITIMPSSKQNYTVTWTAPKNGPYSLLGSNSVTVIGCGIAVQLKEANRIIGECAAFCHSEESLKDSNRSSCNNIGCCKINIPHSLTTYTLELQRLPELNNLSKNYDVKAFVSSDGYTFMSDDVYTDDLFNSGTTVNVYLDWNIPQPQTCEAAKRNESTYACKDKNSDCYDIPGIGYYCTCPDNGNPYIPHGCTGVKIDPSSDCQRKCGKVDIPFPFGLIENCYRNRNFALFCNDSTESEPILLFNYSTDGLNNYKVDEILIEEGQLRVDTTNETMKQRANSDAKPFSYYKESNLFKWGIDYINCSKAYKNNSTYACVSEHSECVELDLTSDVIVYGCKCTKGYEGNPYVRQGCTDIDECMQQKKYHCKGNCQNSQGNYTCTPSGNLSEVTSIGIGLGIGIFFVLAGVTLTICGGMWSKRTQKQLRQKNFHQNHGLLLQQLISCNGEGAEKTKIFTLEEMEKATSNFEGSRIVGDGGHGFVFKGILSDQRVEAIKKSKVKKKSEIDQFINEVVILSRINHRNIVKLFGCCVETEVPLLVSEFISNGTLHEHLHPKDCKSTLSWEDRLRIASETAGALSYLHSAATISIFHRDVKSENILLDEYLTVKLSDFGASRSIPIDQTSVATVVQGTFGYLDPEYHYTGELTEKSDVYSFGVILLELLTGEKPISFARIEEERNLSVHFHRAIKDDRVSDIIDARVKEESTSDELSEFIHLAEICLRLKGEDRPTMKEVEFKLQSLRMTRKQKKKLQQVQDHKQGSSLSSKASYFPADEIAILGEEQSFSSLTYTC